MCDIRKRHAFTLIELLLSMGIISALASIVIAAINPTKILIKARNAQRRSAVHAILQGAQQYLIDKKTGFPYDPSLLKPLINEETRPICRKHSDYGWDCVDNNGVFLRRLAEQGEYFADIPIDPIEEGRCSCDENNCPEGCWDTGYTIKQDANGRITVTAPLTEGDGPPISLCN